MARYRKRRYYKRSKGKWSANINIVNRNQLTFTPGESYNSLTLAVNPAQTNQGVSQTYTVKNAEFSYNIEVDSAQYGRYIEGLCAYIMYVPQGMQVSANYPQQHPEYIMAYRYLGSPDNEISSDSNTNFKRSLKIKTRMARKLQTGDSIIWFIYANNQETANITGYVDGVVRWWTKAN